MPRAIWEESRSTNAREIARGFEAFDLVCGSLARFFESYDVLLTPTAAGPAVPHGALNFDARGHALRSWMASIFDVGPFTAPFNIGGQPSISIPAAMSSDGLPLGVQLVAGYGEESIILQLAGELEHTLAWHARRPPILAR